VRLEGPAAQDHWPQPLVSANHPRLTSRDRCHTGLLPVAAVDQRFLPDALSPWVADIADRMQCPPDFIGIPIMVALGFVIGRKVAVRPQQKTDWYEVPNLWGLPVGRHCSRMARDRRWEMSTLAHELDRYLAIRRSLGFDLSTAARVLQRLVAFAHSKGVDHVTTDLFLGWKNAFGEASSQTWAARLVMVRQFAQWLSGIDPRNEVPPKALFPGRYRRSRPYIYSDREIAQIIDGAARLPSANGIRALTYAMLFGLIAVTGLRISEALALDNCDVDLATGVLTIRRGKSGKARIVPVSLGTLGSAHRLYQGA
jgi:hypothetical protein